MRAASTTSYDDAVTAKFALPRTLKSLLGGSLLVGVSLPVRFERVARFDFSRALSTTAAPPSSSSSFAPADKTTLCSSSVEWHLFVEIMSARSNVILVDARSGTMAAAAHQVSSGKLVRPVQTGLRYELPARQFSRAPTLLPILSLSTASSSSSSSSSTTTTSTTSRSTEDTSCGDRGAVMSSSSSSRMSTGRVELDWSLGSEGLYSSSSSSFNIPPRIVCLAKV